MQDELKRLIMSVLKSSKPVHLMQAEVLSAPPNLIVRVDGDMKKEYTKEFLIVAQHLTAHERLIEIGGNDPISMKFNDELKKGDQVMIAAIQGGQSFFILDRVVTYGS
ncbi:MAG: DUF2577 domain-containing protein [Candidatus Pristimantibacillus sp.]